MNETENKKEYEMPYLLMPEIPEDKIGLETTELKNAIAENGGEIVQVNPPEKKWLAYPVKKQNQAYFGVAYFNVDKEGVGKIKRAFALRKKILRFLILSTVIKPKSSPTVYREPAKAPAPTQSFDQKLESILKG